jgi:hypothetical protein
VWSVTGEIFMWGRRVAYPAFLAFFFAFVLSSVLVGSVPATAAAGGGSAVGAAPPAGPQPDPTSGRRPGPGATARPESAPRGDLTPKRVNVEAGTEPPVAAKAGAAVAAAPAGCGGAMKFGEVYRCSSISGDRQDTFTVTTTAGNDVLYGTFTQVSNGADTDYAGAMVFDADGNYLCYFANYPGTCQLGAAGTYTVTVSLSWGVGDVGYTFAVQSLRTPSACRTLGNAFFSFAAAGRTGELAAGSAGDCYTFNQPTGTVLQLWAPQSTGVVQGEILDGDFQPVCPVQYTNQCTLTSPGPYRVMMTELYAHAVTYTLRMARLSHSVGCPVLRPASFGDPGSAAGTGSLTEQGSVACHQLRTPAAGGVLVRIYDDQQIWWTVFDDAGERVCDKYADAWSCQLPAAGGYTILTSNQNWDPITYQIAVTALHRAAGCSPLTSLAWDQAAAQLDSTSAVQANCQQFRGAAGRRVVVYSTPGVFTTLVDSAGRALCTDYSEETGCALPAAGTYRVVSFRHAFAVGAGADNSYKVQARSLTSPSGCPLVSVGAFNAPPAGAFGPIRCRIVRVTQPGILRIRMYDAANYQKYAAVYDHTGHRICNSSSYCEFPAAGDFTVVLDGQSTAQVIDNDYSYVTSVLPVQPAGCPALSQELLQGAFTDPGQSLCVQLPQPTGASLIELVPTGQRYPFTYVVDSAGNYLCDSSSQLRQTSCKLSGSAPYSAVLSQDEGQAPAPFAARFVRVDGPPSCPVLDGSAAATSAEAFVVCRSIPADGHGTTETFSWHRASGSGGAAFGVFDAAGTRQCGPTAANADGTVTCRLPAGPLTVLLNAAAADAAYEISHQPATTS